jgi:ABC-type lipoprotein release transport system permease subunit
MAVLVEIARAGLACVFLQPVRSVVTVAGLVAVLLPYLACLGLARGIEDEAEASLRAGADLYLTARQFGRPVPIPLTVVPIIEAVPGVASVVPRIVGGIVLGKANESAVVVGLPRERFPAAVRCVEGVLSEGRAVNELVVGTELARRLSLKVGSMLPPFYRNADGERLSKVVGLFTSDVGIWQSHVIFTSLDTAAHLFDQRGTVTDLLVTCKPGYQDQVASAVAGLNLSPLQAHVTVREEVASLVRAGVGHRAGIVQLHFLLALVVSILVILATSGFGLAERRREIGILKATGWQTDQILLRAAVENVVLALAGVALSVVLAFVWLRGCNGYGIAAIFLTGVDIAPSFRVPFRLTPTPVLLALLIGLTVVLSGTLYTSWRAATVPPSEALR